MPNEATESQKNIIFRKLLVRKFEYRFSTFESTIVPSVVFRNVNNKKLIFTHLFVFPGSGLRK